LIRIIPETKYTGKATGFPIVEEVFQSLFCGSVKKKVK